MKKSVLIGLGLVMMLTASAVYADQTVTGNLTVTGDINGGRAVKGQYAIYDNGTADGGDTVYNSNGFDTWYLDNRNGAMRFRYTGYVMATITSAGFNIAGTFASTQITVNNGQATGGYIRMRSSGSSDQYLRNKNGVLEVYSVPGTNHLEIDDAGNATFGNEVSVAVLEIRGQGNDLAEGFKVHGDSDAVKPGMVVAISPDKPGEMELSSKPYQRTVAGIISGAGDKHVGLQLGNSEEVARGELQPVALTGQVWCYVDTTMGGVMPGDLLTTSATPGHAMKVADHVAAQGSVIGKAMTPLAAGQKGLVLVLVTLQ